MSDLFEVVKEADVVSFELVDALLVRAVCRPVDVYRLAHECFNARSGRYLTDELAPHRVAAESALRDEAERAGRGAAPVTLGAVYERVGTSMMLDPATTALLVESELEAERSMLHANPDLLELYLFAVEQGTQVVGVGDSCLPGWFLAEVLAEEGVTALADLIVSSETGASMAGDGAWDDLGRRFPDRQLVHIGTDPRVAEVARRHGVGAHLVTAPVDAYRRQLGPAAALDGPRVFRHLEIDGFRLKNLHRSMLNAVVADRLAAADLISTPYVLGYGALGPFMTAFVQWLHRQAGRRACDSFCIVGSAGQFVADAYRTWWVEGALPIGPIAGGTDEGDGSQAITAGVAGGWNGATGRWDGGAPGAQELSPAVWLCAAADPASSTDEGAPGVEAFVDGRIDAQRSLFDDLFGASAGFLEVVVAGAWPAPACADLVGEIRRGALDFVADIHTVTDGLPSTVAIVDRRTACENLVMVLNFPSPPARHLLERFALADPSRHDDGDG